MSVPFLDRIDVNVPVQRLTQDIMQTDVPSESSRTIRERVAHARDKQMTWQKSLNRSLSGKALTKQIKSDNESQELLSNAVEQLMLSLRAVHRVMSVARTIAVLESAERVTFQHVVELSATTMNSNVRQTTVSNFLHMRLL